MQKLILIFGFITPILGFSQNTFNAGVTTGLVTSQIYGDGYMGFNKAGLKAGLFVETEMKNETIGSFELIFIQKGSNRPANPSKGIYTSNTIKVNYIEVPVILKKQFGKFIYEGGLTFGKTISQRYFNETGEITNSARPLFGSYELGYLVGLNYNINSRFSTNVRYSNTIYAKAKGSSFIDNGFFRRLSVLRSPTHILLSFGIHYRFFANE